mmetsp:Transcript_17632/g.52831  ORF Transcript_17632/g.52831 Transcript_17632/m.52831 type:complete len:219 (+) Transcript_17632:2129-2785(+)
MSSGPPVGSASGSKSSSACVSRGDERTAQFNRVGCSVLLRSGDVSSPDAVGVDFEDWESTGDGCCESVSEECESAADRVEGTVVDEEEAEREAGDNKEDAGDEDDEEGTMGITEETPTSFSKAANGSSSSKKVSLTVRVLGTVGRNGVSVEVVRDTGESRLVEGVTGVPDLCIGAGNRSGAADIVVVTSLSLSSKEARSSSARPEAVACDTGDLSGVV